MILIAFALLLAACRHAPVRDGLGAEVPVGEAALLAAQSAREADLAEADHWRMQGRLAVQAGSDGGSGRIDWQQRGGDYRITLSAPVTRRSWVLESTGGRVTLSGLDGGPRSGSDAEALLAEATGWRLPLQALADWARGARSAGPARIAFAADGLPARIEQFGWTVEYREWLPGAPARPRRVFASEGGASVRLVVEAWGQP
ncbi:hypothetical protein P873_03895 [Arenimonas composti TR7-09 = DSM 18010]|uniref:Outer-membrane lipoprotein LolB n=1 Tax=Arenimonas composti TR7-09 = DSM 18010 TaxID=1121013 RepID=A0A091BJS7_9GAMM|nr:hypothetical protein P873_03895 [Arenimonas composti TR7-09 = DSM 18010]